MAVPSCLSHGSSAGLTSLFIFFTVFSMDTYQTAHHPEESVGGAAGEGARTVRIPADWQTARTLLAESNPRRPIGRHRHSVVVQSTGERGAISGPGRTYGAAWGSGDSQLRRRAPIPSRLCGIVEAR